MRTTLDIDDDLLHATKELARREGLTAGQVVFAPAAPIPDRWNPGTGGIEGSRRCGLQALSGQARRGGDR